MNLTGFQVLLLVCVCVLGMTIGNLSGGWCLDKFEFSLSRMGLCETSPYVGMSVSGVNMSAPSSVMLHES